MRERNKEKRSAKDKKKCHAVDAAEKRTVKSKVDELMVCNSGVSTWVLKRSLVELPLNFTDKQQTVYHQN